MKKQMTFLVKNKSLIQCRAMQFLIILLIHTISFAWPWSLPSKLKLLKSLKIQINAVKRQKKTFISREKNYFLKIVNRKIKNNQFQNKTNNSRPITMNKWMKKKPNMTGFTSAREHVLFEASKWMALQVSFIILHAPAHCIMPGSLTFINNKHLNLLIFQTNSWCFKSTSQFLAFLQKHFKAQI